jgi:hypothetical protein
MKPPRFYTVLATCVLVGGGSLFVWWRTANSYPVVEETPEPAFTTWQGEDEKPDLQSKPLSHIPVGTVIGKTPPAGWSNLVLIAIPTLVAEDERDAPKLAMSYARMFKLTILANVAGVKDRGGPPFHLEKVTCGFATTLKGQETIVSSRNVMGAHLGMFGRQILEENEQIMNNDVRQIARTPTMMIFDAKSVILRDGEHKNMIMRHAIQVEPANGKLHTLVWLLTSEYEPADKDIQLLPHNLWEKRLLSVKRDKFVLGIPTKEAFGLRRVPPGWPIAYTPELKKAASGGRFDEAGVRQVERTLQAVASQEAQAAQAASK